MGSVSESMVSRASVTCSCLSFTPGSSADISGCASGSSHVSDVASSRPPLKSNYSLFRFRTRHPPSRFLCSACHVSLPITELDIGMFVHDLFLSFVLVLMSMDLKVPYRLIVGHDSTHGLVWDFMPYFVGVCSSCTSTYLSKSS